MFTPDASAASDAVPSDLPSVPDVGLDAETGTDASLELATRDQNSEESSVPSADAPSEDSLDASVSAATVPDAGNEAEASLPPDDVAVELGPEASVDAGPACPPRRLVLRDAAPTRPMGVTGTWLRRWPAIQLGTTHLLVGWQEGDPALTGAKALHAMFVARDGTVPAVSASPLEPFVTAPANTLLRDFRIHRFQNGFVFTWARSNTAMPGSPMTIFSRYVALDTSTPGAPSVTLGPECQLPTNTLRTTIRTALSDHADARMMVCGRTGNSLELIQCRVYRFPADACPTEEIPAAFFEGGGRILVDATWSNTSSLGRFYAYARPMGTNGQACTFMSDSGEDTTFGFFTCPTMAIDGATQYLGATFVENVRNSMNMLLVPSGHRSIGAVPLTTGGVRLEVRATLNAPPPSRTLPIFGDAMPGGTNPQPMVLSYAPRGDVYRAAWSNDSGNYTTSFAIAGATPPEQVGQGANLHVAMPAAAMPFVLADRTEEFFPLAVVEDVLRTRVVLRFLPVGEGCP